MDNQLINLIEVLRNPEKFKWNTALYCQGVKPYEIDTKCVVLNPDLIENEDKKPIFLTQNGLSYTLNMADVQSIVSNLKQQKQNIIDSDLLEAFNFYMEHDAFIVINLNK